VPTLSGTPGSFRTPAPTVGQHNDEIYRRIGYGAERLQTLRDNNII
jgi:crotonobetainyl-CoA:carnitine CoA-transferase CaiB-like acyl-CoA transferase